MKLRGGYPGSITSCVCADELGRDSVQNSFVMCNLCGCGPNYADEGIKFICPLVQISSNFADKGW